MMPYVLGAIVIFGMTFLLSELLGASRIVVAVAAPIAYIALLPMIWKASKRP